MKPLPFHQNEERDSQPTTDGPDLLLPSRTGLLPKGEFVAVDPVIRSIGPRRRCPAINALALLTRFRILWLTHQIQYR